MRVGIIGNGVSAVTAVRELLKIDSTIEVEIFSDEPHGYYLRPKLIEFLGGRLDKDAIVQFGNDWYAQRGVAFHPSTHVEKIGNDLTVHASDGSGGQFDKILLATGARPFIPPIPGTDKMGMFALRTLNDATAIKNAVSPSSRVLIVGGGVLGIEIAAAVSNLGASPTVISNGGVLLPAQLDAPASALLVKRLDGMGVSIVFDYRCAEILGSEKVTGVISTEGETLDGDVVIAATGVRPNMDVAKASGIPCGRGVTVDDHMQTGVKGIYASGDCSEWNGVCSGIIPSAIDTAKVAAHNMVTPGSRRYNGTVPTNTLKVAGIDLFSIGITSPTTDDYEIRDKTDTQQDRYYKIVLKDNVIVGAIVLGDRKASQRIQRLVRSGEAVSDREGLIPS
ncbi:MAG: FAD-dependent oxidoreductase [Candidatus Thorarchaeota archaeon]|nr:FAD-dependent oxidoreductase [Candidatus Thorarchaeota archaeon]